MIRVRRAGAVTATLAIALVGLAGPASAHVRVDNSAQPSQGGYGVVRLIVPSESDTAATVGLTVTIPEGVDLTSARTLPIPGWTATVARAADGAPRVTSITWRVSDPAVGLKSTEYGEFAFSAGPWPTDAESVPLTADQSYSDGKVVSWNEVAVDANSDPQHPAPVVLLATEGHSHGGEHGGAAAQASVSEGGASDHSHDEDVAAAASAASADSQDGLWQAVTVAALAVALAALGGFVVLLRRDRRETN